jgi:Ricin-type beta-trefoil lectin domain-like
MASVLSALAVLTALVVVPAAPASAFPAPGYWGSIVNARSNKCLEVDPTRGIYNGMRVQIWDCNSGSWQKWMPFWFQDWSGGTHYGYRNQFSGTCLDVDPNRNYNGTAVYLWDCNRSVQQGWNAYAPSGAFEVVKTDLPGNRCLDAWDTYNGAAVKIWDCNYQYQQMWF